MAHNEGVTTRLAARLLAALAAASGTVVGCGAPVTRPPSPPPSARAALDGAVLLALPGTNAPFVVPGSPHESIRGRVRYQLSPEGVGVRRAEVTAEPIASAVAVPAWLGGGVAYVLDDGLAVAGDKGALRPIVRGNIASLSIGARELWARERVSNDWLRVDLGSGKVRREAPPIAAPILSAWSSAGSVAGRAFTAGPEFFAPKSAIAIVDLLGPVLSRDGGETWTPLERATVAAAFPGGGPKRVVREGAGVALASDDRLAFVGGGGSLGAPAPLPRMQLLADASSVRVESEAPFGVELDDDELVLADGGRFAVVARDPLRVLRVTRLAELGDCELSAGRPPSGSRAERPERTERTERTDRMETDVLAACVRHAPSAIAGGGQVAVGALRGLDGVARFDVERTFAFGSGRRFSASAAAVVASSCLAGVEGGIDLLSATKVCVRDGEGRWTDLAIGSVSGRRHVVPRADGGVLVAREDAAGKLELLALERGALTTTTPTRLRLDERARDLAALDEIAPGRAVAWFRTSTELRAVLLDVGNARLSIASRLPARTIDGKALVGLWADRAMVIALLDGPAKKDLHVDASLTTDGGRNWSYDAWPKEVRPLDIAPGSGKRLECGPVGCRALGWSRLGWHKTVAVHDTVLDLANAPALPPAPSSIARSTSIAARCTSLGAPKPLPLEQLPTAPANYPFQPNDVLLGLPAPKAGKDQAVVFTGLGRNVRGGFVSVGPTLGAWGDAPKTVLRFASDLDPLGSVAESAPFALFADRNAAMSATWSLRPAAWALGPKRILVSLCGYARCDVFRAQAGLAPERIELASAVSAQTILGARELGPVLAVLGAGWPVDASRLGEPQPFVALVSAQGVTASFFARASWASEAQMAMSVEPSRGGFGVLELTTAPAWTHGTGYVLPLGVDGRPSGAFELLSSATPDVARPTSPCGAATPGWDDGDAAVGRSIALTIDGATPRVFATDAGVLRSRVGALDACLERITVLARRAAFQFDAHTGKAAFFEPSPDGKGALSYALACSIAWQ